MKNGVLNVDVERDMDAILSLIYGYMDKTYITDLKEHVNHYRKQYEKDASKEVGLLKALIPFVPEQKQKILGELSDLLRYEHILQKAVPSAMGVRNDKTFGDANGNSKEEILNQLVVKIVLYKLLLNIENR